MLETAAIDAERVERNDAFDLDLLGPVDMPIGDQFALSGLPLLLVCRTK